MCVYESNEDSWNRNMLGIACLHLEIFASIRKNWRRTVFFVIEELFIYTVNLHIVKESLLNQSYTDVMITVNVALIRRSWWVLSEWTRRKNMFKMAACHELMFCINVLCRISWLLPSSCAIILKLLFKIWKIFVCIFWVVVWPVSAVLQPV